MRSEMMAEPQCQIGIDTTTTTITKSSHNNNRNGSSCGGKGSRVDSPLDFSTKKKFKPEPLTILLGGGGEGLIKGSGGGKNKKSNKRERSESVTSSEDPELSPDSPCSRLRNILSMKSPLIPEDMAGTVLNLSKESPLLSSIWCKSDSQLSNNSSTSTSRAGSSNSNSCSPPLNERGSGGGGVGQHHSTTNHSISTMFLQSNSPRPATIPSLSLISGGGTTPSLTLPLPGIGDLGSLSGTGSSGSSSSSVGGGGDGVNAGPTATSMAEVNSLLGLPPSWGAGNGGIYSPSISPILNQTVPTSGSGVGLPLSFETSPTLFPHHMVGVGAASPALPFPPGLSLTSSNGNSASSKGRTTRPFKAYPKDPLSFSSVGLYGLPLGTAPGTTEAVIHQQSNQAYAEFRKQMLTSSQFGKARRAGGHHRNSTSPYPSLDSLDDDHHLDSSDNGPTLSLLRANDSGSASDEGSSLISGKNRLGKSEQQMKDEAYWERRRKNNEAAKRSRDARRAKEDEIAIRAAFLEQENLKLRFEVCALKSETAKLRCMLYSS